MHLRTSELAAMNLGFGGYTCNWGTHFCGLYESEAERDAIMFGFLAEGLRGKDLLICCPEEQHHAQALGNVEALCPDCPGPEPGSLRLFHPDELYHPEGHFDPLSMLRAHDDIWDENLRNGSRSVRGTAEMGWALEKIPGVEDLMAYESILNTFIWGKPWISICLYDVNRFPGAMIMRALQTHPFVISGGVVFENPYFIRPEKWLAKNAPQFLEGLAGRR